MKHNSPGSDSGQKQKNRRNGGSFVLARLSGLASRASL